MNDNDNIDATNVPTYESEEVVVEEISEKDLKNDKFDNHQNTPRKTNAGAGVEILYPSFTRNSYHTMKRGKKLFTLQDKIKEKFNKGVFYKK